MAGINIRLVDLDCADPAFDQAFAILSGGEVARAERIVNGTQRRRFVRRRAWLRRMLGAWMGEGLFSRPFIVGAHGKPELPGGPPFSVSSSGGLALLAISDGPRVGCDLERLDAEFAAGFDWRSIAPSIFTGAETEALSALDDGAGRTFFYQVWTMKEAYLKGLGVGLRLDPRAVNVLPTARLASGWRVFGLQRPAHSARAVAMAVAAEATTLSVTWADGAKAVRA